MTGDEVKNVQLILEGLGFQPGRTDGYFNEATKRAVLAFQKAQGLPQTGVVNAATAAKLEEKALQKLLDPENDAQLHAAVEQIQKMLSR